jgi:hypothetical protein
MQGWTRPHQSHGPWERDLRGRQRQEAFRLELGRALGLEPELGRGRGLRCGPGLGQL